MNISGKQSIRNFFIKPVLKGVLQSHFKTGDIVSGKIIQSLPKQNLFVLHTRGMNLAAFSRLALFIGDRVIGRVIGNEKQIELKLLEVNGQQVHKNVYIREDNIAYTKVPLSEDIFGENSFLEIYPDQDSNEEPDLDEDEGSKYHLILSSQELQNIVLDFYLNRQHLIAILRIEDQDLFHFLQQRFEEIQEILLDEGIKKVNLEILPLTDGVGNYRKKWLDETNLDIRA